MHGLPCQILGQQHTAGPLSYHPETIRCRNKVLILFIGCIQFMMAALDR